MVCKGADTVSYKEIMVKGSPYNMGLQYGSSCREDIQNSLNNLLINQSTVTMVDKAALFKPMFEELFPEYLEEVKGIAVGAKITLNEALYLQVRWDIPLLIENTNDEGCTSYAISSKETENRGYYSGLNKDVREWSMNNMIVLKMIPDNGPKIIALVYALIFTRNPSKINQPAF